MGLGFQDNTYTTDMPLVAHTRAMNVAQPVAIAYDG